MLQLRNWYKGPLSSISIIMGTFVVTLIIQFVIRPSA